MNNDLNINEMFLASDGNGKYFYGEIKRLLNNVFGKIFIRDHEILSTANNENILSGYLDDTVNLIVNHDLLNNNMSKSKVNSAILNEFDCPLN
jgi:hypothetical protein